MSNNLLEKWYEDARVLSSPINIKKRVSRDKVKFIYSTLQDFFSSKYFEAGHGRSESIEKSNWIHYLLANTNYIGCYGALYQIAKIIEYSRGLEERIQIELKNLKWDPKNLRPFFFELFLFMILDGHGIPNKKNYVINNQEVEGTCEILDKEFLFECRKVYMPGLEELDVFKRILEIFYKYGKTINKAFGMICLIKFARPIIGEHKDNFEKKIKVFFEGFNRASGVHTIDYIIEDSYGIFKAVNYDQATLIEAKAGKMYDVIFTVEPPVVLIHGIPNKVRVGVSSSFSISQSKIYKRFENALREKKKQHKDSPFKNKIVFIDSETFPEFQMGLFQNSAFFDIEEVRRIYRKLRMEEIVCIIRRYYIEEKPSIKVNFLYRGRHNLLEKVVK